MSRWLRAAPMLRVSRRASFTPCQRYMLLNRGQARFDSSFTNILASDNPPAVQVASISEETGIQLADGLRIPGACVFLEGTVFLWDVPGPGAGKERWKGWLKEHFELFEVVVPRPELLILGTGNTLLMPPPFVREHLKELGIGLDVMDSRNACSTYNLLAEEGRRVAAALLPLQPYTWPKNERPAMKRF